MSSSHVLRHVRHLISASIPKPTTISFRKARKLFIANNADEALKTYSDFTSTTPVSTGYPQELTVRNLAKSNQLSDIVTFLESLKTKPEVTDEAFLSSIIRCYGIAGMFENALKTFEQMSELGTPRSALSLNTLLKSCSYSKMADHLPDYFTEFPAKFGFLPDKYSYGFLIKWYCDKGLWKVGIEKMSEMEEKGLEVDSIVFTTILQSIYENGKRDEAEKFWDEMVIQKGLKPDVESYNVHLLQGGDGEPEKVKKFIDEMSNAGVVPNVTTYNYLITCYCEKEMVYEAKNVYDELLQKKGCNPNAATFRTIVFHMCKHKQFLEAYKVFKMSVYKHKIPAFDTLKYLIEGLAMNGHEVQAENMIRVMKKKSPYLLDAYEKLANDLGLAMADKEVHEDSG